MSDICRVVEELIVASKLNQKKTLSFCHCHCLQHTYFFQNHQPNKLYQLKLIPNKIVAYFCVYMKNESQLKSATLHQTSPKKFSQFYSTIEC